MPGAADLAAALRALLAGAPAALLPDKACFFARRIVRRRRGFDAMVPPT